MVKPFPLIDQDLEVVVVVVAVVFVVFVVTFAFYSKTVNIVYIFN